MKIQEELQSPFGHSLDMKIILGQLRIPCYYRCVLVSVERIV